jgi:hypothetical protein
MDISVFDSVTCCSHPRDGDRHNSARADINRALTRSFLGASAQPCKADARSRCAGGIGEPLGIGLHEPMQRFEQGFRSISGVNRLVRGRDGLPPKTL